MIVAYSTILPAAPKEQRALYANHSPEVFKKCLDSS